MKTKGVWNSACFK